MNTFEVPPWPWDTTLGPTTVTALINAADATNTCVLALAHAKHLEQQADTAWQQAQRGDAETLSLQLSTHALAHAASMYCDELLRVYSWQALHFARLAAPAMIARLEETPVTFPLDAAPLLISHLCADPTALPAPLVSLSETPAAEALRKAYMDVLDAIERVVSDPDHTAENYDLDPSFNTDIDIWGQGLAQLASALHEYASLCLGWAVGRTGQ